MFKKLWFSKKVYPIFRKEVKRIAREKKVVFLWKNESDYLLLFCLIEESLLIIKKEVQGALTIEKIDLPEKFLISDEFKDISFIEFQKLVLELKTEGMSLDPNNVIEFINQNIKNSLRYYNFTRPQIQSVFEEIVIKHKPLYQHIEFATIMQKTENKWID